MIHAAVRGVRGAREQRVGPFRVRDAHVVHPNGDVSAVVRTGDLDIEAMDPARAAAVVAAFSRLCRSLDRPLQLLVRVRPVQHEATVAPGTSAHGDLEAAQREHWSRHADLGAAHTHTVLLAVRAAQPAGLDTAVARVEDAVRAIGVGGTCLRDDELLRAVTEDCAEGHLAWRAEAQHVVVNETLVRGFALRRLPGHPVPAGWLAPLLRVPVECDIAIHIAPAALGDALHTLGRRLRDFSAHRMLESERGVVGDVHVDVALDSAMRLRGRLARNLGRPLLLSITAAVRAPTLDELHRRSERVRLGFRAAMVDAEPAHFRHLAAYVTALPLCIDSLGAAKLVESEAAATCVPWVEAMCDDPGGYRIGVSLGSGVPVRLAPFDTARHANANIAVFAASGHGKSFALGALMLEAATHGAGAVVIDPEGEHEPVVNALGGRYLRLAPGGASAVNVFDSAGDDPEDAVAAVTELVAVLGGGRLDDVERAVVDAAAREAQHAALANGGTPILAGCIPMLQRDAPRVAAVVRRFCTGALGALFNRPTSVRLNTRVCGISLRDMPAEHLPAAAHIVARWLWALVRRDRSRRLIVFDEVGALCGHAPLRALLVQLARRCRKYGASLVVATQNAQDLLGTDEGSVVATNCAVLLLGGHRPAETARMERAFGLTERQRRFLEACARGEFLLMAGDRRLEMRIEVPELHRRILLGETEWRTATP
ncbi:MAG: DUF87 domain-containing protein [Candidatus Dormibacteraeota bacterium]|nr:DUF87 domain-containing protein [Candidatus Dormibacteraeota bacterium]MBV9526514.1 DUF87 domain-containing protein [Candidatus Dormibacteraeota bacterium]